MKHGGNVWEGQPTDWLDFSANLRPEGTPAWVMDTMRAALAQACYYPDRVMRAACAGLSAYLGVPESCVLPTAGGAAAIDLALSLRHGAVHVQMPTFGEYAERARVHGRSVVANQPIAADDTVVLCNPNNPTGALLSPADVLALHREVHEQGGELMVDEAFIDYCPQQTIRHAVADDLTVVGSLTKILCIPGVRLGYICASPRRIAQLRACAVTWSLNVLASAIAERLPLHQAEIAADAAQNQRRAERFAQKLRAIGVQTAAHPVPFLLVRFDRDMTETVQHLHQQRILVRTCDSFGLPANTLRLAVKTDEENDRLIAALCKEGFYAR